MLQNITTYRPPENRKPSQSQNFRSLFRRTLPLLAAAGFQLHLDSATAGQCHDPRVRVTAGWLEGTREGDGLDRYLGVPYAAPPLGDLRWQPPQPVAAWQGVRPANALPPRCAQIGSEGPGSEDCLYLNVFVPEGTHRHPLPVLFYIHGGSLRVGSAWDNDPSRIARETNSVVVMVNYRLGMLGFLNHPALDAEAEDGVSGNYGLMDQQLAMQWVHDEIDRFGGNPENITIAGMSAGAWSVCAHLTSDSVEGTFSRAVLQSGECHARDSATAGAIGSAFADTLGCSEQSAAADCLRNKTVEEVLATDSWAFEAAIVWGGSLLPEAPRERVAAGDFARVPVMFGFVENELRVASASLFPLPQADYEFFMTDVFGENVSSVQSLYPPQDYDDPYYALIDAVDDAGMFGSGCHLYDVASQFAAHVPTYVYRFDDQTAPNPTWVGSAEGFVAGASHGSDEPYWFDRPFDTLPPLTAAQTSLSSEMVQHLGEFMQDGTPGGRHTKRWGKYDDRRQRIMQFLPGESEMSRALPEEDNCGFWKESGF